MYRAIIAIGTATAACLVAGCGGSSDETAEAAATKAQFIKQAEAICNNVRNEAQDAAVAWEKANDEMLDVETAFEEVIGPSLKREAKELQALTVPDGDAASVARMIENLSQGAAASVKEGPTPKSSSSIEAFQREAKRYGLAACQI